MCARLFFSEHFDQFVIFYCTLIYYDEFNLYFCVNFLSLVKYNIWSFLYSNRNLALYKFYKIKKETVFSTTSYWDEKIVTFDAAFHQSQYFIDRSTFSVWFIIFRFRSVFPKSSVIRSFSITITNFFIFLPFFASCCNNSKQSSKEYADHYNNSQYQRICHLALWAKTRIYYLF